VPLIHDLTEIESAVISMYEQHPFPSIKDKRHKAEAEMPLRLTLLGIKPEDYIDKKVLDAGCGTGEYSCWYANQGSYVTGVDLSEASLQKASEYAAREGINNVKFEKQSVLKLNFPDASFDYVASMGVLHHTPDPRAGFEELCRVLRPGGVIVISLYNKFGRFRHNVKQFIVKRLAGNDIDKRVAWAKRLFPRTCSTLQKSRNDEPDVILYDAFGIPHESQHTIGEVLEWFDSNRVEYMGAFGPVTVRDNLLALSLLQREEFSGFKHFFEGFSVITRTIHILPRTMTWLAGKHTVNELVFGRPSWLSRSVVQSCWFVLGFKFSIFSLAGRKAEGNKIDR
jgi:2-polyprenyl-3-methyl-5-hydroxy-6-metoxy-1,4-benzoquinol methylase